MIRTETVDAALQTIRTACVPEGILAGAVRHDNYARIWSRDSAIAGIAGSLYHDDFITAAWGASVQTLAFGQSPHGQIPSNIGADNGQINVSYGTLAGRVDATSWWIISASLYVLHTGDAARAAEWRPRVDKALQILQIWEMNERGLVYTPLGGNWADEYVYSGYLLYDQVLRVWALRAAGSAFQMENWREEAERLTQLLRLNFSKNDNPAPRYHAKAYAQTDFPQGYWPSGFGPQGYDVRWDMAANALSLLLGINEQAASLSTFLSALAAEVGHWMLPVFWPVIRPGDPDWRLLADNHLYAFKNQPYCFHNGGSWPVFLGWLTLALTLHGEHRPAGAIALALDDALHTEEPPLTMHEFWRTDTRRPGGVPHLCYTAAGALLAAYARRPNNDFAPLQSYIA
ncbi:MAG: glycoside hydrolase 100 family protein [Saprospiraceae bacterium]|nr:glycoside hydrolase 100 family protein [Saprospiraceae bacterium]